MRPIKILEDKTHGFSQILHQHLASGFAARSVQWRPYSEHCINLYDYQINWYFARFDEVSVANFKQGLMQISIAQFAKRLKLYEAVNCFAKFLIQEGLLDVSIPEQLKKFKPRRHLPPKKVTVDQAGIDQLLAACTTPIDKLLIVLLSQTGLTCPQGMLFAFSCQRLVLLDGLIYLEACASLVGMP